jgi:dethiobiotin synthetase
MSHLTHPRFSNRLPETLRPQFGAPAPPLRGLFVTATGTEIGKTVVASAIAATLAARGERVAVFKPAVTGLAERDGHTPDHEMLRASARSRQRPADVAPYRFGPALSPHLAAQLAGVRIQPSRLVERAVVAAEGADTLIVEGVGGLAVPLTNSYLVRDFAADLGLPVLIVARPGLGTINHTLLTVEAARARGLHVLAVVLTGWPDEPTAIERSNRETVAALAEVEVATLGQLYTGPPVNPVGDLPLDRWLPAPARRPVAA